MPMLRRGYGAVKNLRCKSGARFPPSTVYVYISCKAEGCWGHGAVDKIGSMCS